MPRYEVRNIKCFGWILLLIWGCQAYANEEVAIGIRQYDLHISSGFYEDYETMPKHQRLNVPVSEVHREVITYSSTGAGVRIRTRLADAHVGLRFYERRQCWDCHVKEALNHHTVKGNITCRQCHGEEPIAAVQHYYSAMNPIRRHAYVCSKCHVGASASFAQYIIHEPVPGAADTHNRFPVLYYVSWFMLVLFLGTLAFFVPHTLMMGIRELFHTQRKDKS